MLNSYRSIKAWLSFHLGKNPVIEKSRNDFRKFIPDPFDGVVLVSTDFELAWAWRFDKLNPDPKKNSLDLARKERDNIPKLIKLSQQFNIPLTWGTVGHLFLKECKLDSNKPHADLARLPYFENDWWKYHYGDWFDADPCSSVNEAPEWYAPDLVKKILDSPVGHEIACHSFSHISCEDSVCSSEIMEQDLSASQKAANSFGINLESFIFPGHTMGNYNTLRTNGYTSIRTNFTNLLGYPECHLNGLWEHKATMELSYNRLFSVNHNLYRFKTIIEKCIQNHQVCNLWFHPSCDDINTDTILPGVYSMLDANREKLWITTMREYTYWLTTNAT